MDAQRRLLNPDRVTVGNASDLAAEVRCSEIASGNAVTWLYQNRTAVSSGLRAFGTTQGDGVLRIYPATLLSGGSGTRFWCMDIEANDVLSVILVLRKYKYSHMITASYIDYELQGLAIWPKIAIIKLYTRV